MKLQILFKSLPIAVLTLLVAATLSAQTERPATVKDAKTAQTERSRNNADELAKELNLSEEQKGKIKKIDEEHAAKVKASREAKREDATKLREERIKAYKSVMTPEQATKYDEIRAKKKAEKKDRPKHKNGHKSGSKENRSGKKATKEAPQKQ